MKLKGIAGIASKVLAGKGAGAGLSWADTTKTEARSTAATSFGSLSTGGIVGDNSSKSAGGVGGSGAGVGGGMSQNTIIIIAVVALLGILVMGRR